MYASIGLMYPTRWRVICTCFPLLLHHDMTSGKHMKVVSLIILVLYLLLPLACFAHPCESCLGNTTTEDSTGTAGKHSHNQDADNCDSTTCCAASIVQDFGFIADYRPIITEIVVPEQQQKLQQIVFQIFIPPQNLA